MVDLVRAARLQAARVKAGFSTQKAATDAFGWKLVTYKSHENGNRGIPRDWLPRYAKAFRVDTNWLAFGEDNVVKLVTATKRDDAPITVKGAVQAGYWSDATEWHADDWYSVSIPVPEDWRPYAKFGLEVHGASMNKRYPEKSVLACVKILDADIEPSPGHRYIVQRENVAGEFEMTVKELRADQNGKLWLWPDSTDPEHQTPLPVDETMSDHVTIQALVIASVQPE